MGRVLCPAQTRNLIFFLEFDKDYLALGQAIRARSLAQLAPAILAYASGGMAMAESRGEALSRLTGDSWHERCKATVTAANSPAVQ